MHIEITMEINDATYRLDPDHPNFPGMFSDMTPFQLAIAATYLSEIIRGLQQARQTKEQYARQTSGTPTASAENSIVAGGWLTSPSLAEGNVPTWREGGEQS
jgi:hypothetical protein